MIFPSLQRLKWYGIGGLIVFLMGGLVTDYIKPSYDGIYNFTPPPVIHTKETKTVSSLPTVTEKLPIKRRVIPIKKLEEMKKQYEVPESNKVITEIQIPRLPEGGKGLVTIDENGKVEVPIIPEKPSRFSLGGPFEVRFLAGKGLGSLDQKSWLIRASMAKEVLRTGRLEWWMVSGFESFQGRSGFFVGVEGRIRFNLF